MQYYLQSRVHVGDVFFILFIFHFFFLFFVEMGTEIICSLTVCSLACFHVA